MGAGQSIRVYGVLLYQLDRDAVTMLAVRDQSEAGY